VRDRVVLVLRALVRLFGFAAGFAAVLRVVELDFRAAVRADFLAGAARVFFAAVPLVRLLVVRRLAADLRFGRAVVRVVVVVPEERVSSIGHLPDMTRCAASATASAISAPSFVALDITDLAALSAVSAASIPASLIALRAFGLALIAAAAAASPAASISLLIAAFASLSTVFLLLELLREEVFEVDLRLLDFAIADLRSDSPIRPMNSATVPLRQRKGKGNPQVQMCQRGPPPSSDPLEHGQRPEVTAVRSAPMADEHPFPTSLLNHETSDHLLSLR
jgi:hypothetical protein